MYIVKHTNDHINLTYLMKMKMIEKLSNISNVFCSY